MQNKLSRIFIITGAVLILSALFLWGYNRYEDKQAGKEAENTLMEIEAALKNQKSKDTAPSEAEIDETLPVIEINGYEYIGYLSIPELELELPVMAEWSYERLKIAPCREMGSSRSDNLVIAAHNYPSHFGRLKELNVEAEVIFTDMEGLVNQYAVKEIRITDPYDVEAVKKSGYDLVLYTCTLGGKTRVTVFCNKI